MRAHNQAALPKAHGLDVNGVAWSPSSAACDGGWMLASCCDDELVKLWQYSPPSS
eukprot:SAG25_NODE_1154_length_3771_cov_3.469227_4_plen_55_part_00